MKKTCLNAGFLMMLVLIWQCTAWYVKNSIICPSPWQVFEQMMLQISQPGFFAAIFTTLARQLSGLLLSFIAGLLLAWMAFNSKAVAFVIEKILLILRAIPNIALIILLLFWLNRKAAVLTICFLLVCPIIYTSIYNGLCEIQKRYTDVFAIYKQSKLFLLKKIYFPLLKPEISSSLVSGSSLCFKSCVMAEVLCQVQTGIGRSMQSARFDLNVAGVMGWTLWLLIFVFAMDYLIRKGLEYFL
jgi:NitT/TauT family transport system permease protein